MCGHMQAQQPHHKLTMQRSDCLDYDANQRGTVCCPYTADSAMTGPIM